MAVPGLTTEGRAPQAGRLPLRARLAAPAIALLATATFAAWVGWGFAGDLATLHVDEIGTVVAGLVASALCVRAGRRNPAELRRFWWLLAGACAAWALGDATWAVYDLILQTEVPVPSWADLAYLAGMPLAVAAVLSHPAAGRGARRTRSTLDGLLAATALLLISWTLVLHPVWQQSDVATLGGLVTIAYPFGDVVIVFFLLLIVRRMPAGDRLPLWWLGLGLLILALTDSVYVGLAAVQGYEGGLIDTGWFAGYLAIAVGAWCARAPELVADHAISPAPSLASAVIPFVPILAALGLVGLEPGFVQTVDPVALIIAFALVSLVLGRQLLLIADIAGRHREGTLSERLQAALAASAPDAAAHPPGEGSRP